MHERYPCSCLPNDWPDAHEEASEAWLRGELTSFLRIQFFPPYRDARLVDLAYAAIMWARRDQTRVWLRMAHQVTALQVGTLMDDLHLWYLVHTEEPPFTHIDFAPDAP